MEKKTGHLVMKNAKSVKSFNAMNNRTWERIEKSRRYRCAAAKDIYMTMTEKIDNEVLDGIFLNLGERAQSKSPNVQNRILHRIVEKRMAQASHRKNGRTGNLEWKYFTLSSTSDCLADIKRKRWAA